MSSGHPFSEQKHATQFMTLSRKLLFSAVDVSMRSKLAISRDQRLTRLQRLTG